MASEASAATAWAAIRQVSGPGPAKTRDDRLDRRDQRGVERVLVGVADDVGPGVLWNWRAIRMNFRPSWAGRSDRRCEIACRTAATRTIASRVAAPSHPDPP